jgi:hypothetical protein
LVKEKKMAQEFDPVISPEGNNKKNNTLLIVVIVLILLCCCCFVGLAALYYLTEPAMEFLGIPIPWY